MRNTSLEYYKKLQKKIEDLTAQSSQRILSFWQHILLVSSSLDGILISLRIGSSQHLYIRWAFLLSIGLLTLGVLTTSILLYDHSMLIERCRQQYVQEVRTAIQEDREIGAVLVQKKKRTTICEWISAISLILAVLLILSYAILRELLV